MSNWLTDVTHAVRVLRRNPGFSLIAIVTLGAGVGAATLMFCLVHTVLLRKPSFAEPDRLVWMYNLRTERDRAPISLPDFEDYRRDATTVNAFAAFINWTTNLSGGGPAERLEGTRVSGDFFAVLGTRPLIGRTIEPHDESGNRRVAVLTHGLWQRRFGADAAVVGKTVILNGAAYTVIGVMGRDFLFPFRDAEIAVPLPLHADPRRTDRGANFLRVLTRLAPGVSVQQARADLNLIAQRLQRQYPNENSRKTGISLYPLHAEIVRDYQQILWTLFAAVFVLLAVGCGNLANLMLLRGVARRSELSLRVSLGASRARILRQLAVEGATIAVAACALGLASASVGLAVWRAFGPVSFPRMTETALSLPVSAFAVGLSMIIAIGCGVAPAHSIVRDLRATVGSMDRTMTGGRRQQLLRRGFVMLQVSGSVVLIVCMTLVARAFAHLERVDVGFNPDRALSLQLSLQPATYASRAEIGVFYERLDDRLRALPGVEDVGAVSLLPLSGLLSTIDLSFPDRAAPPPEEVPQAHFRIASPGYFAAAGIPVVAGREFARSYRADGQMVALVSETFATRHWPGRSAIGQPLQLAQTGPSPTLEVVGVVSDVKQFGIDGTPTPDLYVPIHQVLPQQAPLVVARMYWVVRSAGAPHDLIEPVRQAVQAVDSEVATSSVRTLSEVVQSSLGPRRASVRMLEAFSLAAFFLCVVGIYAVAAFSVGARRRELAIRAAIGATRTDLGRLVLTDELVPLAAGVVAGLTVAFLVLPRLGVLLFDVDPSSPAVYVEAGISFIMVGLIACYLPARRACRVNPAQLLRA